MAYGVCSRLLTATSGMLLAKRLESAYRTLVLFSICLPVGTVVTTPPMKPLFHEIRRNPLLWLLVFVPVVLAAEHVKPHAHTLHFVLSVVAILPLATLLSHATESVA